MSPYEFRRVAPYAPAPLAQDARWPMPYDVWLPGIQPRGFIRRVAPSAGATFVLQGVSDAQFSGRGWRCTGGSGGMQYADEWPEGKSSWAYLIVAHRNSTATGSTYSVVRKNAALLPIQEHSSGVTRMATWDTGGLYITNYANSSTLLNRVNVFAAVRSPDPAGTLSGAQGAIWVNGIRTAQASMSIGTIDSTTNPLVFGDSEGGGETATPWTILLVAVWQDSVPTESALVALQDNPWQLFKPARTFVLPKGAPSIATTFNASWAIAANSVISSGARAA